MEGETKSNIFDVNHFIDNEIHVLESNNWGIQEVVLVDGKKEVVDNYEVDWQQKLAIFKAVSLTKPAYQNHIQIDTIINDETVLVKHQINSKQHDIKTFDAYYLKKDLLHPFKLEFTFENRNFLYHLNKRLSYESLKGFTFEEENKVLLLGENKVLIEAKFIQ